MTSSYFCTRFHFIAVPPRKPGVARRGARGRSRGWRSVRREEACRASASRGRKTSRRGPRRSAGPGRAGLQARPSNWVELGGLRVPVRLICGARSEEHTSELQSQSNLVCRLLLEKKKGVEFDNGDMYVDGHKAASDVRDEFVSVTEKLMDELAQCYNVLPQLDINNTIDHRPEGDEKWFLENEKTVTQFCRKLFF